MFLRTKTTAIPWDLSDIGNNKGAALRIVLVPSVSAIRVLGVVAMMLLDLVSVLTKGNVKRSTTGTYQGKLMSLNDGASAGGLQKESVRLAILGHTDVTSSV